MEQQQTQLQHQKWEKKVGWTRIRKGWETQYTIETKSKEINQGSLEYENLICVEKNPWNLVQVLLVEMKEFSYDQFLIRNVVQPNKTKFGQKLSRVWL